MGDQDLSSWEGVMEGSLLAPMVLCSVAISNSIDPILNLVSWLNRRMKVIRAIRGIACAAKTFYVNLEIQNKYKDTSKYKTTPPAIDS